MKKYSFLLLSTLLLFACQPTASWQTIHLKTMGTTGVVKFYTTNESSHYQQAIDSILLHLNQSLSTYIDTSTLSFFNQNKISLQEAQKDIHFAFNYKKANEIQEKTNGFFNPAIFPLVNYWKVQNQNTESYQLKIDSTIVDSLVQSINATNQKKKLDFSAIAKGYGVDLVSQFLAQNQIDRYMVEIGGEVRCKGKNARNKTWKIGIEEPNETTRRLYKSLEINNKAMATSGNYRNFKILDSGQKIVHIINPKTGYPEISNLLSATIIANTCAEADAYATACMAMGTKKCLEIVKQQNLECLLLYSNEKGEIEVVEVLFE